MKQTKTPGQIAYETDVQHEPLYLSSGRPRKSWYELEKAIQDGWESEATLSTQKPVNLETCARALYGKSCVIPFDQSSEGRLIAISRARIVLDAAGVKYHE